ncbi:transglutaminase domain-containing protein [Thalassobacillus sp. CUG 92003]|uniref:transglutaminase TgpA family protein n=1 Tax=Thalassobacillus sp. CUG 92003 TaxID=2736641 RepID=UPI0015E78E2B|nr:transglutaminase domain-containing protein [Thalassobacillus sp. CUG 92003]
MNGMSRNQQQFIYQILIYVGGFFLFWEWLRPLEQITETKDVAIFTIYAAFCFFISFLQVNWWFSIPLKFIGLVFILDGLYIMERIFSRDWFRVVSDQIVFNSQVIQNQQWWEMTPFFRSLLFLLLLWLMSYLLYYWFVIAKRMLFFIILTFVYVTVLDTFTVYDGKSAIIRTFVISLFVLGLSSFAKEMEKESIPFGKLRKAHLWVLPLIAVVLVSTAAGYAAPKFAPQWPDPVPYIQSATGGSGSGTGGVQKVGYGENDEQLGGSFVQDDTTVFRATAPQERYWRIESKDRYTGKGWEDTLDEPVSELENGQLSFQTFSDEVETEEEQTFLDFTDDAALNKLVYPYGGETVDRINPSNEFSMRLHENTGEVDTLRNSNPAQMDSYQMTYEAPSFEYDQLRQSDDEEDPEEIKEPYLQLPDDLPGRVQNLAEQIVQEDENRYDRAKAIESYFTSNDFEYNTTDVATPGENQDYVDQFLFETQLGYCDNFSSAMVVLLRSVDIPARWVKGFTGGEQMDEDASINGETYDVYEVSNSNAHSWVEVYFPGQGWVPFEPTKGFSNNTDFHVDMDESGEEDPAGGENGETPEGNPGNPQEVQEQNEEAGAAGNLNNGDNQGWWRWGMLGAVIIAVVSLYVTRYKWMAAYIIRRFRNSDDAVSYQRAYHFLLKVLAHKGYARKPDQTLRDYAVDIDRRYQSSDMLFLTHQYERILYRNEQRAEQPQRFTELWENLIKRTLS